MILLATSRGSTSYSPLAIISLTCLTFAARSSSPLRASGSAILCGSRASLETLTLADSTVRPTLGSLVTASLARCLAVLYQQGELRTWTPFVDDFHHSLFYIRFIGKSASFFSPKSNLYCRYYMVISKTFYQTIELSVVPFDMVRSRTLGRSVSRDGGPQNGDERQWRASTAQTKIPGDTEGGTIRLTESAIDHNSMAKIFSFNRHNPCRSLCLTTRPVRTSWRFVCALPGRVWRIVSPTA